MSCSNNAPAPVSHTVRCTRSSLGRSEQFSPHSPSGLRNMQGRGSACDRGTLLHSRLQQRGRAPPRPANGTSGSSDLKRSLGAQGSMPDARATPPPPARGPPRLANPRSSGPRWPSLLVAKPHPQDSSFYTLKAWG
ncbi:hypothetical protein NDU88_002867 [Pleurodeles waltl]|uniref:Uncharacterized protein n=1 Tax=Pleurodeles waltl TaxID=8319 RepID=A0AAV7VG87_PLEWA|nr:hypothetical protein NDU88_002867 [Pleurodeles waltl]